MHTSATPLTTQIAAAIARSPHVDDTRLTYETHEGHVVLRGTVGSYFQKQMAQEALRQVDGISRINNEVVVSW